MLKKILASLMVGGALMTVSPMVTCIPNDFVSVAYAQDYWVASDGEQDFYVSDKGLTIEDLPKGGCRIVVQTKHVSKDNGTHMQYGYIYDNIHGNMEDRGWMWIYKGKSPTKLNHLHRCIINKCFELKGIDVKL